MKDRAQRITIPTEMRKQIKHEQGCTCPICEQQFTPKELYIHHIKPVSHHRRGEGKIANRRENLVALCSDCHEWADDLAFKEGVYISQLIDMEPNREYALLSAD